MKPIYVIPVKDSQAYQEYGEDLAKKYGFPFRPRNGKTIRQIQSELDAALLVVNDQGCYFQDHAHTFRYHMGMAPLRLKQLKMGKPDYLLDALQLKGNETIVDATFGFGADSLVLASRLTQQGKIWGVESSNPVFYVASEGLQRYIDKTGQVTATSREKIQLFSGSYENFLTNLAEKSVDCVYFDPMFRRPVPGSVHMDGLRDWGEQNSLTTESLYQAVRVARRKVVIKARRDSRFLNSELMDRILGGKYSNVAYGVIDCET